MDALHRFHDVRVAAGLAKSTDKPVPLVSTTAQLDLIKLLLAVIERIEALEAALEGEKPQSEDGKGVSANG